jgi:hypothetical protein
MRGYPWTDEAHWRRRPDDGRPLDPVVGGVQEVLDTVQLRELHDDYVWEVNAAIGEGRMDLVWQFVDDYVDLALRQMTAGEPDPCDRPGCTVCAGMHCPAPARRGWLRRLTGG